MFHNRRLLSLSSEIMMQQTAKNAPTKTPDKNNHIQNTPNTRKRREPESRLPVYPKRIHFTLKDGNRKPGSPLVLCCNLLCGRGFPPRMDTHLVATVQCGHCSVRILDRKRLLMGFAQPTPVRVMTPGRSIPPPHKIATADYDLRCYLNYAIFVCFI